MSSQKTSQEHGSSFAIFRSAKGAQLPATGITEQSTLLTKSKINRLVLVLVIESKVFVSNSLHLGSAL